MSKQKNDNVETETILLIKVLSQKLQNPVLDANEATACSEVQNFGSSHWVLCGNKAHTFRILPHVDLLKRR